MLVQPLAPLSSSLRSLLLALAMSLGAAFPAQGQATDAGPLEMSPLFEKEVARGNIMVMFSDTNGPSSESELSQGSYDYVAPDAQGLNAALLVQERQQLDMRDNLQNGFFGEGELDQITADWNGDEFDEFAAAWARQNGDIRILIPTDMGRNGPVDSSGLAGLNWTTSETLDLQDEGFPEHAQDWDGRSPLRIRMAKGDFDGDQLPEFAVAYWSDAGRAQVVMLDTQGGFAPLVIASANDHVLPSFPGDNMGPHSIIFDLAGGDFDDDGVDELALVAAAPDGSGWGLVSTVYAYDTTTALAIVATTEGTPLQQSSAADLQALSAATGDTDGNPGDELVVVAAATDFRLLVANVNLNTELVFNAFTPALVHSISFIPGACLAVGDLDGLAGDEIAVRADARLEIWRATGGSLAEAGGRAVPDSVFAAENSPRCLDIFDLDPDLEAEFSVPEIIYGVYEQFSDPIGLKNRVRVQVYSPDLTQSLPLITDVVSDRFESGNAPQTFALGGGAYNGPDIRLGQPKRFEETTITSPLIILNAPPIHFDVIGGSALDVNNCFPIGGCTFTSTYREETVNSTFASVEFHSDFTLSKQLSGEIGASVPGVVGGKLEGSLKGTVGEGFSKITSESQALTVSTVRTAIFDDWVHAGTITYDVWEYPVFLGDDITPIGYVAVMQPQFESPTGIQTAWFPSKSFLAASLQPAHEVGNILSYERIAAPQEANGFAESVRWATGDLLTMSPTGTGSWTLGNTTLSKETTSFSSKIGLEVSLATEATFGFDPPLFSVGEAKVRTQLDGTYEGRNLSTTEVSFQEHVGLSFDHGLTDGSVGQTNYGVIPYAYWAKTGALVLDYAVDLELSPGGGNIATFWQDNYGTGPDLSFIQPWRTDPEKGLSLGNDPVQVAIKREESRDIRITPDDPRIGDTVTISARIQNYSILQSPSAEVQFYIDDPALSGMRIFPDSPGPLFTGIMQPLGSAVVSFEWTVPQTFSTTTSRIYAIVDPGNDIPNEIHEDNNRAWSALSIPAPEPSVTLLGLAALSTLGSLRRRR